MTKNDLAQLIESYKRDNHETWLYGQKRGNCGVIAADFMLYCEKNGIDAKRISGAFIIDKPELNKIDFTPEEKNDLESKGFNFNSFDDRKKYAEENNLIESHKYIPHYWNIIDGEIVDLSGDSQFIKRNLANNISPERYIEGDFSVILANVTGSNEPETRRKPKRIKKGGR